MKYNKPELLSALKFGTDDVMKKFNITRSEVLIMINQEVADIIIDDMKVVIEKKSIIGLQPIDYGLHEINIDGDIVRVIVNDRLKEIFIMPATQKMKYQYYISDSIEVVDERRTDMNLKLEKGSLPKDDIEITEEEITEFSSKLNDDEVTEYANDYGITLDNARHDLARYILYNDKLNTQASKE